MNRKQSVIPAVTVACALLAGSGRGCPAPRPDKKDKAVGRLLFGKVLDPQDNPLPDAVVYVTNTRTRAVKTYIVGADGTYRFPGALHCRRLRGLRPVQGPQERHQVGQPVRRPLPGLPRPENRYHQVSRRTFFMQLFGVTSGFNIHRDVCLEDTVNGLHSSRKPNRTALAAKAVLACVTLLCAASALAQRRRHEPLPG